MTARGFALAMGIVFILVGICGFVPGLVRHDMVADANAHVTVHANHGRLFGLFPVNVLHNCVHLLFGVLGLASYRSYSASGGYARLLAIAYGLLAIMGLIPAANLNTVFGLIPIHSHDVWLHAVIALAGFYFGFVTHRTPTDDDLAPHDRGGGYTAPHPR